MERDEILNEFGLRIRGLRISKGLSQEKLGHICNLDRTYISGIERGVRNPSLVGIYNIALGLGISLEDLFKYISVYNNEN